MRWPTTPSRISASMSASAMNCSRDLIGDEAAFAQAAGGGGADAGDAGRGEGAGVATGGVDGVEEGVDGVGAGEDDAVVGGEALDGSAHGLRRAGFEGDGGQREHFGAQLGEAVGERALLALAAGDGDAGLEERALFVPADAGAQGDDFADEDGHGGYEPGGVGGKRRSRRAC
jgi:hypothetical protein